MTVATGTETQIVDLGTASYKRGLGHLVALFRSKGISADEAQDLAHETILRVLIHVKRHGRSREDLGPLARTIARNLLVERLRKGTIHTVDLSDAAEVADDAPDPLDHTLAIERREAVHEALGSLTPRHRRVVQLWMQGRSPAEIARELGIKRNAADALLHRARRTLASRLGPKSLWSGVTLPLLRMRESVRDWAESIAIWSPSLTHTAPAALSVAGVAIAALLSTSTPAAPVDRDPATLTSTDLNDTTLVSSRVATPTGDNASGKRIQASEHVVHPDSEIVVVGSPDDTKEPVGLGLVHKREDDGDRGTTGPTLDRGIRLLCPNLGEVCQ